MEIIGYIASIFIGVSLGLIGGGGSILTVPVLVYLFSIDAVAATAHSFFIVGITSVIGSLAYFKQGLVNVKIAVMFGSSSIMTVFLTRAYIVPAIPQEVCIINGFVCTKSILMMLLFAVLMVMASYSMIKKNRTMTIENREAQSQLQYPLMLIKGMGVGILTGLVGAGGGFLIIPVLVVLAKLPMKEAVGTSLVIIAANSLIGFWSTGAQTLIDWTLLMSISVFAIIGIFVGMMLSKKIDGAKLKPMFGWFVLMMGMYIIIKETIIK